MLLNCTRSSAAADRPRLRIASRGNKTYNVNTIHDIHKLQILILIHKYFHRKETTQNL